MFLDYSVAVFRLARQLKEQQVAVNSGHPLFVYVPSGVGGAPGGIVFCPKQVFHDAAHCFFVEPVQAPCMQNGICVQDPGLTGTTEADGLLAVPPASWDVSCSPA